LDSIGPFNFLTFFAALLAGITTLMVIYNVQTNSYTVNKKEEKMSNQSNSRIEEDISTQIGNDMNMLIQTRNSLLLY
jgi:hypothetical protein